MNLRSQCSDQRRQRVLPEEVPNFNEANVYLQDAKESRVIDCRIYNHLGRTGIAVLTGNYHFYVANNVGCEVRSRRFCDPPGEEHSNFN